MDLDREIACLECGYDLQGLGGRGACPECGAVFDLATGRGVSARSPAMRAIERGDRVVFWAKVGGWTGAGLLCLGLGLAGAIGSDHPERPVIIGGLFAAVMGFGAFVTYKTEKK